MNQKAATISKFKIPDKVFPKLKSSFFSPLTAQARIYLKTFPVNCVLSDMKKSYDSNSYGFIQKILVKTFLAVN